MSVQSPHLAIVLLGSLLVLAAGGVPGCSEPESEVEQIQELEKAGDVDALAKRATEAEPDVGRQAVRSLGRLGPRAEPALRQLMKQGKAPVRSEAALVYPRVTKRQEAQAPLSELTRRDPEPHVRAAAVTALGHMRALDTMDTLLEALNDPNPVVRQRAADAVARIMGREYELYLNGPEEKRVQAIENLRQDWNESKDAIRQYYQYKAKRPKQP